MNIDLGQVLNNTRASSGNIEKSFRSGYYIGLDWKINSQSTSSNSSSVTATVYIRSGGSSYTISSSSSKDVSVTIDGTKYLSTCTVGLSGGAKKNLFSKTVTVKHNSDGTKTCSFACGLDINVTLGGSYYGKITHSGSGTLDKINLNSAPSMSGSVSLSPSGTIPENQSSVNVSWKAGSDAQNNISNYILTRYVNGVSNWSTTLGNVVSYSDNISSFGQGTRISYKVKARDSYGLESGEISSSTVTKNVLTGATIRANKSIGYNDTDITLSWSGASNTNGDTSFSYIFNSDEITIYNKEQISSNATSVVLKIRKSTEETPSTPYINLEDIKKKVSSSGWKGNLSFKVTTKNKYNSQTTSTVSVSVDLRVAPTKPTNISLSGQVTAKGSKYFVPSLNPITITWKSATDLLGGSLRYDVYRKVENEGYVLLDGGYDIAGTLSITDRPSVSSLTKITYKIVAKTPYGTQSESISSQIDVHYYSNPVIEFGEITRTETTATIPVTTYANTSISGIGLKIRRYVLDTSPAVNFTGSPANVTLNNLLGNKSYTFKIEVQDDTGLSQAILVSKSLSIPTYTPLFSVREKGVAVGKIPDGSYDFEVVGDANVQGNFTVNGRPIEVDWNNAPSIKAPEYLLRGDSNNKARFGYESSTKDVFIANVNDNWFRLKADKTLTYAGYKVYTAFDKPTASEIGALPTSGGTVRGVSTFERDSDTQAIVVKTLGDGNGVGDGNTHFGYYSDGRYHHYFRGNGKVTIDNALGLQVNGTIVGADLNITQSMSCGSYADNWRAINFKRGTSGTNYEARYGVSYGNVKLSSSNASAMTYGAVIESHNTSSAQARYLFGNTCFTPLTDNNKYCGTSSHRWSALYASTGTVYSSSKEEKSDIQPIEHTRARSVFSNKEIILDGIKKSNMYSYKYRALNNDDIFIGFLGQELEEQNKEFFDMIGTSYVTENGDTQYDIRESSVIGVLWTGLQSALQENEDLRKENEDLRTRLEKIEKMLGI